jgi:hypothetical protein
MGDIYFSGKNYAINYTKNLNNDYIKHYKIKKNQFKLNKKYSFLSFGF